MGVLDFVVVLIAEAAGMPTSAEAANDPLAFRFSVVFVALFAPDRRVDDGGAGTFIHPVVQLADCGSVRHFKEVVRGNDHGDSPTTNR